jgi:N-methylhydantoinase A/oxoprolinase/acetone carboxylase beta subunit
MFQRLAENYPEQKFSIRYLHIFLYSRSIIMGTTIVTNALLERTGTKTALIITKGFKDLLQIGNQSRPKIFDLRMKKYEVILKVYFERYFTPVL